MDLDAAASAKADVPTGEAGVAPTEMELRVAKALEPAFFAEHEQVYEPRYYKELQDVALGQARAAIRAMLPATQEMVQAAENECTYICVEPHDAEYVFRVMIDAASPSSNRETAPPAVTPAPE